MNASQRRSTPLIYLCLLTCFWNPFELWSQQLHADSLQLITQQGHKSTISALTLSANQRWLASGSKSGEILLWDRKTGLHHPPMNAITEVYKIWFIENDQLLLVKTKLEFQIWSIERLTLLRTFQASEAFYHPDSQLILMLSAEGDSLQTLQYKNLDFIGVSRQKLPPKSSTKFELSEDIVAMVKDQLDTNDTTSLPLDALNTISVRNLISSSPDARYVVLADNLFEYKVVDVRQLSVIHTIPNHEVAHVFAFDEQSQHLVIGNENGLVELFNLEEKKIKYRFNTSCFFVKNVGDKKTIRFELEKAGEHLDRTNLTSCAIASILIRDNKIFTSGYYGHTEIWDLADGRKTGELPFTLDVFAKKRTQLGFSPPPSPIQALLFDPIDQILITGNNDQSIHFWKIPEGYHLFELTTNTHTPSSIQFHPTQNLLAVAYEQAPNSAAIPLVNFWDISQEGIRFSKLSKQYAQVNWLHFNTKGDQLITTNKYGQFGIWDWKTQKLLYKIKGSPEPALALIGSTFEERVAQVVLKDLDTTEIHIISLDSLMPKSYFKIPQFYGGDFSFTHKNEAFITMREDISPFSKRIAYLLDLNRSIIKDTFILPDEPILNCQGDSAIKGLRVITLYGIYHRPFDKDTLIKVFDFQDFTPKLWFFHPQSKRLVLAESSEPSVNSFLVPKGHSVLVLDITNYHPLFHQVVHEKAISSIALNGAANLLATAAKDGFLKIWDIDHNEELVTLAINQAQDFFITTPEHYYYSSKTANSTVALRKNKNLLSFDQFDLKYNRPDKVLKALKLVSPEIIQAYQNAYQKRLKKMNILEANLLDNENTPEVTIVNKVPLVAKDAKITVSILAKDANIELDRINIWVNDVPIFGIKGIDLSSSHLNLFSQNITIILTPGVNKIQVSALNKLAIESAKELVMVSCIANYPKPDLHLICLGSSLYKNSEFNLTYPVKDAMDIVSLLKKDTQYANIYVDTLFNHQLTKDKLPFIRQKLGLTKENDRVILFVAGHGILDDDLNYYFGTYDTDFKAPMNRAIPIGELEKLLDGIPARHKLLLIDACHSGEIDRETIEQAQKEQTILLPGITFRSKAPNQMYKKLGLENAYELMRQLFMDFRLNSGATIIVAASGVQFAQEGGNWKNGVFTWAFLNGISNKTADLNDDGIIMLTELKEYLSEEVDRQTNGLQRPILRTESLSKDWKIW